MLLLEEAEKALVAKQAEIDRLRDKLKLAAETFRAIASEPTNLNPGYDHYATCRQTAKMAAEGIEANLSR